MAVSVYGIGKNKAKKKKGEKSHAEKGRENIRNLVTIFRQHAIGSENDMHLNHVGFRSLCQDLLLGSHDVSSRLFAAMDTDNTGAVDIHEFWKGMRCMHDIGSTDKKQRVQFAFNLFNVERTQTGELDDRVDRQELVGFLSSFYTEACDLRSGWLRRWIDHFETIFGKSVASVHAVGRTSATRWEDTTTPLLLSDQSHLEVRNAARSFCDSVLELVSMERTNRAASVDTSKTKEKRTKNKKQNAKDDDWDEDSSDDHSLGLAGFASWCDTQDQKLQLHVLSWLEELGSSWLNRSGLMPEERMLDGLASTSVGFSVERRPGGAKALKEKFEELQDEQIHVLFASHSSNSLMGKQDFETWFIKLGVSNPYIRGRLFDVFDRDHDRFIDFEEFQDGLRKLIAGKSTVELAFSLFDVDANGVIGEDELRGFMRGFFEQLTIDVNESMRVLATLLSSDNDDVITVTTCARDSCQQFIASYTDAVVQNVFRAAKSGSDRRRGQRGRGAGDQDNGPQKLFVSEFMRWCRENNDCVVAFFESLSHKILEEMGAFTVDKPEANIEFGQRPQDHRSKLMRLIDPQHHLHKPHLPHLAGGKHDPLHFRHTGDELFADSHDALQHDVLVGHHKLSQHHHLAHLFTEDFHRVLVATGIEVDAGVIQRHAEHWSSKRLAISEQVAHSEANRYLREGKRAMKLGKPDEAVYLFKRGIEQEKQLDQERLSANTMTKEEVDAHNERTDDLHKNGLLDRDQAEQLKGGISDSLQDELDKAINASDERDFIIVDEMIEQEKHGKTALDKKHAAVKQPGKMTGAPAVPPPSSCFPRDEVHRIQDIFLAVSQDGIMGPAEWTRCLRFAGIVNEVTALRLFELFDASGDLQLNAKEFTCGLSEICNGYQPGKPPEEVRREFAFRFYDVDGEGHFDKNECCAHMKSYRLAARKTIDRRITEFCTSVFGMVERALTDKVEPKLTKLTDQLDEDLTDFVEDIFTLFGDDKAATMNWEHFKRFTLKAPMVVDWLTNLGRILKDSFTKMDTSLNFEEAAPIPDPGSVIDDERVLSAFKRFAGEGGDNALIDEGEFVELMLTELKVSNPRLARLLFRAFDDAGDGAVTRSDFLSRWKLLTNDDILTKRSIIFKLFDVTGKGYVDNDSLRLLFLSFFDTAIESVETLRKGLDEWVNGEVHPDSKLSNGVPNHFFVGVSRKKKFHLAKDLLKLAQAHVSNFVDVVVEHVKIKGKLTLHQGFDELLNHFPTFINWLSSLCAPWMVLPAVAESDVNPDHVVIQPGDVGKTAATILDRATKETMASASLVHLAPGSVWWANAMGPLSEKPQRIVMRPKTNFDRVWLADIKTSFANEITARRVYDPESLELALEYGIGLTNHLIVDRLYRMFDVNQDGNLTAAEIATGLLLLGMGSLSDRMQVAFDLFDLSGDGIMMCEELSTFLSALRAVSVDVINSQIELLGEVFGPPASGVGQGVRKATEFRENINAAAKLSLDSRVQMLQERAFATDDLDAEGARSMTRAEFMLFLQVQPTLESWVARLGIGCLEALAPLEDRAIPTTGRRPTDSTYRARRKYPKGTQFDHLRVDTILQTVKQHAHYGWLDQHAFAQVMCELRVYQPATLRRLHTLLDFSNGGSLTVASNVGADEYNRASLESRVHVRDASASLLLLSGDSWRVKFRNAFFLYDADGRGRLYHAEWLQLLRAFGVVGLDVIRTAVSAGLIADLVGDSGVADFSSTVLELSHGRLLGWLNALEKSCERFCDLARNKRRADLQGRGAAGVAALAAMDDEEGPGTYIWEDVEQWAAGHADFGRWMDSLRNLWLDSIIELEPLPGSAPRDGSSATVVTCSEYGYDFTVKKIFPIQMPPVQPLEGDASARRGETVLTKKLQYRNPYATPLSISLHTDSPAVLTATFWLDPQAEQLRQVVMLASHCAQIAPGCSTKLALRFVVPRADVRQRRGRSTGGSASKEMTIRLFVHNENEQRCEECIAFDIIGI